ncbi:SDR family oxidoreductase [Olivibacter sp. CPCC 100613]|uniref:SDR family oxidoreductase n=1 Tax=Olivibacter sp. CPCC 100613 TaxID=3079931 RepID=UPI002FF87704
MTKNWFITGTSSGIGRILTEHLLASGHTVFATLRQTEQMAELRDKYPKQLYVAYLELTDIQSIHHAVATALEKMGQIDVAVSNAGLGVFGAAEELDDDKISKQIEVNLLGSIRLIKALIPIMRQQQDGGHIIQVSSEGGQIAYPGFSLYHASKWGIEGFIEATAQDVQTFNIRFTIAEPGPTGTNFGSSLFIAPPLEVYRHTAVNDLRKFIDAGFGELDDVHDVVQAILDCANHPQPPFRLPIGKVAVQHVQDGLQRRLDDIRSLIK